MEKSNNLASYYFHQGTNFFAYEYLGVNLEIYKKEYRYTFRTWAPGAVSVCLISDFSGWDKPLQMKRVTEGGVWELIYVSERSLEGQAYKFRIESDSGVFNKGDPYARRSVGFDDGASLIYCESKYSFRDSRWLSYRKKSIAKEKSSYLPIPINIYEVHLGSFIRHADGSYYTYRELADILAPYVKALGYTHIEILPIQEFPYDGSWGYQTCAFFSPTSRFGTPDDFKYFIDKMHGVGIGVILDFVCAHFPKDEWGLFEFDGGPLYEYQGRERMESAGWGTRFFDVGREEVQCFLISSALYFIREYHIDGLRVDAVASMIYLDYEKREWVPNIYGTNENLEATAFFRKLNEAVLSEHPDILMIAEESGSFTGITKPTAEGGLGFNLKWNMGFANDLYAYLSMDSVFRKHAHKALNFPLMYAFCENYCLPISHDEVVHGKRAFIDKMYGSYEDKFLQARAALLLIMTYPGKKLLFMSTELAQFREWDFNSSVEWFMLDYPTHYNFREYVAALNNFYLRESALWQYDFSPCGFEWIFPDEADKNLVAFRRISDESEIIAVISFSGREEEIKLPLPDISDYEIVFESGGACFTKKIHPYIEDGIAYYNLKIPKYSGVVMKKSKKGIKIKLNQEEDDVL